MTVRQYLDGERARHDLRGRCRALAGLYAANGQAPDHLSTEQHAMLIYQEQLDMIDDTALEGGMTWTQAAQHSIVAIDNILGWGTE